MRTIKNPYKYVKDINLQSTDFYIALAEDLSPSTIITTDLMYGEQLFVRNEPCEKIDGGYLVPVTFLTNIDKKYDLDLLKEDIEYIVIGFPIIGETPYKAI